MIIARNVLTLPFDWHFHTQLLQFFSRSLDENELHQNYFTVQSSAKDIADFYRDFYAGGDGFDCISTR